MTEISIAVLTIACCVFLTAATSKLRGRAAYLSYLASLADTRLAPRRWLPAVAAALVSCELLAGVGAGAAAVLTATGLAVADLVTVTAIGLAIAVTAVLAAGIAVVLRRGISAPCACFGATATRIGRPHLVRSLGLLCLLVVALSGAQASRGQPTIGGTTLAATVGVVVGLLLIKFDDLAALFAPAPGRKPK